MMRAIKMARRGSLSEYSPLRAADGENGAHKLFSTFICAAFVTTHTHAMHTYTHVHTHACAHTHNFLIKKIIIENFTLHPGLVRRTCWPYLYKRNFRFLNYVESNAVLAFLQMRATVPYSFCNKKREILNTIRHLHEALREQIHWNTNVTQRPETIKINSFLIVKLHI